MQCDTVTTVEPMDFPKLGWVRHSDPLPLGRSGEKEAEKKAKTAKAPRRHRVGALSWRQRFFPGGRAGKKKLARNTGENAKTRRQAGKWVKRSTNSSLLTPNLVRDFFAKKDNFTSSIIHSLSRWRLAYRVPHTFHNYHTNILSHRMHIYLLYISKYRRYTS